jgi:hypothetical protein
MGRRKVQGAALAPIAILTIAAIGFGYMAQRNSSGPPSRITQETPSVRVVPANYKLTLVDSGLGVPAEASAPFPNSAAWARVSLQEDGQRISVVESMVSTFSYRATDGGGKLWPVEVRVADGDLFALIPRGHGRGADQLQIVARRSGSASAPVGEWAIDRIPAEPRLLERPDGRVGDPWSGISVTATATASTSEPYGSLSIVTESAEPIQVEVLKTSFAAPDRPVRGLARADAPFVASVPYPDQIDAVELSVSKLAPKRVVQRVTIESVSLLNTTGGWILAPEPGERHRVVEGVSVSLQATDPGRDGQGFPTAAMRLRVRGPVESGTVRVVSPTPEALGLAIRLLPEAAAGGRIEALEPAIPRRGAPPTAGRLPSLVLEFDLMVLQPAESKRVVLPVDRVEIAGSPVRRTTAAGPSNAVPY